jgi:hypothetical protein
MNTLSDITNIENDTEVIFVHALNNLLFVFSHSRKKTGYFNFENVLWVAFLIPSGTLSLVNKT